MPRVTWGIEDALHRGDDSESVAVPDPAGDPSIVRHILYIDGAGRSTPYCSTTDDAATARMFAGDSGRVWYTLVERVHASELRWISHQELLALLRGKGKGDADWPRASDVQQARALVEQWGEHLIDFRSQNGKAPEVVGTVLTAVFSKGRP